MVVHDARRPAVRLVRPTIPDAPQWRADPEAEEVIGHDTGRMRVLGGPGSGKTEVIARAAAAKLNAGAPADSLLILTFTRRGAAALRDAIVAQTTVAVREVPVRSFESYAWAVLDRAQRRQPEWSTPKLITGPEQDAIIRELIEGSLAGDSDTQWPSDLRAALPTRGFAAELRDTLMRCAERGISDEQLREWASEHDRPEWHSIADFRREYAGVTGMRLPDSYDPAELVRAVVDLWQRDPAELAAEHTRLRHVWVDEAQELDPAKSELVRLLGEGISSVVLVGDPDQSVFGFRGADRRALIDADVERTVTLEHGYRASAALSEVLNGWSDRMGAHWPTPVDDRESDLRPIVLVQSPSPAREAADVAAQLRERHLVDGIPWTEMGVVTRSVGASLPVIRRAFAIAGVPLEISLDEPAVGHNGAVRSLIDMVRLSIAQRPDVAVIEEVLRSAYFRLDALMIRRLRKALRDSELRAGGGRSSSQLLMDAVTGGLRLGSAPDVAALRALVGVLDELRAKTAEGAAGEELLYAAWRGTDAQERWRSEALRGGQRGADADQRLDAVIAAFDIASSLTARLREASFETIVAEIESRELAADRLRRGGRTHDSVAVVSANNAKGRQWDVVAVMGVQDGAWPNVVPRNTLLGTEDLADLANGIDIARLDRRAETVQDERRLFHVAISRARRQLIVSAVEGVGERPSRFYTELMDIAGVQPIQARSGLMAERRLTMLDHVAQLRACLVAADVPDADRDAASESLAMLAAVGVVGAAPDEWYALREASTLAPIVPEDQQVRISPSAAVTFMKCPLRWFLSRIGEQPGTVNTTVGTLVHKAFEAIESTSGRSKADLLLTMSQVIEREWETVEFDSSWDARRWRALVDGMVERLAEWLFDSDRAWVANEISFQFDHKRASVRGMIDRLERTPSGDLYTVDLKTGTIPSRESSERHPQLGIYQLAVESGALGSGASAGAELLYVKARLKSCVQTPLARDTDPRWADELMNELTEGMSAASFPARPGELCRTCPFESICPAVREADDE